jgi:hypothetical protein
LTLTVRTTGTQFRDKAVIDIVSTFERLQQELENPDLILQEPPYPNVAEHIGEIVAKIRQQREKRPRFFQDFDYEWCFNTSSYKNILEVIFQYYALSIISDIDRSHPKYDQLGNIAVRCLGTCDVNMSCLNKGSYKYIIVSTALIRILQETTLFLYSLYIIGKGNHR